MKKILLNFFNAFKTWFVKKFWPWFLESVWPLIKAHLAELLAYLSKEIFGKIKKWWNKKSQEKEETISSKISEAEEKAAKSKDKSEVEKQKAIANVWREVAEMMRKENEELNKELNQIKQESFDDTMSKLDKTKFDIKDNDEDSLLLAIGDKETKLQLPKSGKYTNKKTEEYDMDLIIAPSQLPFRWNGEEYKILNCGIENNESYAEVEPKNEKLEEELKRRIKKDSGLNVYLGLYYTCFTEDYPVSLK